MGERSNLTVRAIEELEIPKGADRATLHDAKVPGLQLVLREAGGRDFYLYKRVPNKGPKRLHVGGYPEVSIDQARRLAAALLADIANGIDPSEQRRKVRAEGTLEALFQHYRDTHAKLHKKTWEDDEAQFDRYLDDWRNRKVSSITESAVAELHRKTGSTAGPYAANRLLALLSAMFNHAKLPNPAAGVRKFKEKQRDRFLQADELPRFFAALDAEPNETIRDFIYACLFTGARRGNVQAMRFDEVNVKAGTWRIPDTKAGEPQTVHLSAAALEIIERRRGELAEAEARRAAKEQREPRPVEWVFPGRSSGHLQEPKAAWAEILKRANITDLRIHDLRRTLGSWQAATGASLPVIGKSLGHKNVATTAIYSRLDLSPVKVSVNTATDAMLAHRTKQGGDAPPEGIAPALAAIWGTLSDAQRKAALAAR